jgi:hypothetical protein
MFWESQLRSSLYFFCSNQDNIFLKCTSMGCLGQVEDTRALLQDNRVIWGVQQCRVCIETRYFMLLLILVSLFAYNKLLLCVVWLVGCFIDFKKAYDSARKEVLYNILIEFGIPMKLVRTIKMCLSETYSKVRIGKRLSDSFPIQNGLKQGMRHISFWLMLMMWIYWEIT